MRCWCSIDSSNIYSYGRVSSATGRTFLVTGRGVEPVLVAFLAEFVTATGSQRVAFFVDIHTYGAGIGTISGQISYRNDLTLDGKGCSRSKLCWGRTRRGEWPIAEELSNRYGSRLWSLNTLINNIHHIRFYHW